MLSKRVNTIKSFKKYQTTNILYKKSLKHKKAPDNTKKF